MYSSSAPSASASRPSAQRTRAAGQRLGQLGAFGTHAIEREQRIRCAIELEQCISLGDQRVVQRGVAEGDDLLAYAERFVVAALECEQPREDEQRRGIL